MLDKYYRFRAVFLFSLLFGFIIHGYRFMNMNLTHDSILFFSIYENHEYLISIGRFLYHIFYGLFPIYTEPFFCGLISLFFLAIGNCFLIFFLELNKIQSLLVSSVITVSVPFIIFSASYLPGLPLFSLSYSLCCIGLFFSKNRRSFIIGTVFLAFAMGGEDQSIIQFACMLSLLYVIKELFFFELVKDYFLLILKYVFFFILTGIVYYCLYKLSLLYLNIFPLDSYNSSNNVSFQQIISNLTNKSFLENYYILPYKFFFSSETALPHIKLVKYSVISIYIFLLFFPIYSFFKKKLKIVNVILYYFFVIVSPFVYNSVYLISSGVMNDLMKLSFYFPIFLGIVLIGIIEINNDSKLYLFFRKKSLLSVYYLPVVFMVFASCILAKNAYFVKEQQFTAFILNMNRILYGIENNDSYIPNNTKVIFIGNLDDNNNVNLSLFNSCSFAMINTAFGSRYPMIGYINYIGYKINILDFIGTATDVSLKNYPEIVFSQDDVLSIKKMPVFPQKGYIRYINDVLFVKLSG